MFGYDYMVFVFFIILKRDFGFWWDVREIVSGLSQINNFFSFWKSIDATIWLYNFFASIASICLFKAVKPVSKGQ